MAKHPFIYINNSGLTVYAWQKNRLYEQLKISDIDEAFIAIRDFFETQHVGPVRVFIDILEETYSLESIPHLKRSDRKLMMKRKLKQLFPRVQFSHYQHKAKGTNERRDDLVLFSAINDDDVIKGWLHMLYLAQVKVEGLYSVPILLEEIAGKLKGSTDKLIISLVAGKQGVLLRQSFFRNDILALSRFKQINVDDWQQLGEEIKEDVNRSQRFVSRHFGLSSESGLSSYFFSAGTADSELFNQINFAGINLTPKLIACKRYAEMQGDDIADECGLSLYLAGINARRFSLKPHYSDNSTRFYFLHFQLRRWLNMGSAAVLLLGLGLAMSDISGAIKLHDQYENLRHYRIETLGQIAKTKETPLFHGLSSFQLITHFEVRSNLQKHLLSPRQILSSISLALESHPQIFMRKLEWGGENTNKDGQNESIDLMMDPTMMEQEMDFAQAEIQTVPLKIEGRVDGFQGDYRDALNKIEQFRLTLEKNERLKNVVALSLPVENVSGKELSGSMSKTREEAKFVLEMEWSRHDG